MQEKQSKERPHLPTTFFARFHLLHRKWRICSHLLLESHHVRFVHGDIFFFVFASSDVNTLLHMLSNSSEEQFGFFSLTRIATKKDLAPRTSFGL